MLSNVGVQFMKEPEHVKIAAKIDNRAGGPVYPCQGTRKNSTPWLDLMDVEQPELAIVFGRKRRVDELVDLKIRGFRAERHS